MSTLKELLNDIPVEWKAVGYYIDYIQPTKYLVSSKNYHDDYNTPVLTAGKTFILGYTDEKDGIYPASKKPVIIFDDFTTANKWVDFDFKAKSSAMKILKPKDETKIVLKYFYYWLNSNPSDLVDGDHKRQWISNYSAKEFPIPFPNDPQKSLAIQQEIVRILDSLNEQNKTLTTALANEIDNRKKQYAYYREELFRFEGKEVEWKTLGDVGEIKMCKRIFKSETKDDGDIPFYKIGTFGKTANAFISKELYETYKSKYSYPKKGDILISAAGTIGRTVVFDGEPSYFQDSNIIWIDNNGEIITNQFLCHFYTIAKWYVSGGGIIDRLYNDNVRKTKIPIPFPNDRLKSIQEQERIVHLLDRFDAAIKSIIAELEKEIVLRNNQYQCYRDLLLSFPNEH